MGVIKIFRKILMTKMRLIRVLRKTRAKQLKKIVSKTIDLKYYLNNLIQESNLTTTTLGKSITKNMMTGT